MTTNRRGHARSAGGRQFVKKFKNARCRGCNKMFDNGGYKHVKYCPTCYDTAPTTLDQSEHWGCCYMCTTRPLGYLCLNPRCGCPQHAPFEQVVTNG